MNLKFSNFTSVLFEAMLYNNNYVNVVFKTSFMHKNVSKKCLEKKDEGKHLKNSKTVKTFQSGIVWNK